MNKKGQTLVAFLLVLPALLLMLALVINTGLIYIEKRKLESSIKSAIKYRFESEKSEEEIYETIMNNLEKEADEVNIIISNNYIRIKIKKNEKNLILSNISHEYDLTYSGTIDDKLIIRKE